MLTAYVWPAFDMHWMGSYAVSLGYVLVALLVAAYWFTPRNQPLKIRLVWAVVLLLLVFGPINPAIVVLLLVGILVTWFYRDEQKAQARGREVR